MLAVLLLAFSPLARANQYKSDWSGAFSTGNFSVDVTLQTVGSQIAIGSNQGFQIGSILGNLTDSTGAHALSLVTSNSAYILDDGLIIDPFIGLDNAGLGVTYTTPGGVVIGNLYSTGNYLPGQLQYFMSISPGAIGSDYNPGVPVNPTFEKLTGTAVPESTSTAWLMTIGVAGLGLVSTGMRKGHQKILPITA